MFESGLERSYEPASADDAADSPRYLFIVPGALDRVTGGSIYDKRLYDYLKGRGARVDVISLPDLPYFAGLVSGLVIAPLLALKLARRDYDLIIEDGWAHPSLALFNLLCRVTSRHKLAVIVHQLRWLDGRCRAASIVARRVERSALKSCRLIITVSRFMSREIEDLIEHGIPIIISSPGCDHQRKTSLGGRGSQSTSIDGSDSRPPERPPVRLLFVGNCSRRKGLHTLIRALALVGDPLLKLDVVGDCLFDPAYTKQLRREVARLGLRGSVTFHGRASDESLSLFYAQADLFVMPSSYEGFGIVYAEAMRAGLPIIACDTGPAAEIVSAGENALLVPHGNIAALADAIRRLAADAELRELYGRRSVELSRRLPTWNQTCAKIFEHLSTVARAREIPD
jgi:glycosyltransferase involved in cell wall biosynthesis